MIMVDKIKDIVDTVIENLSSTKPSIQEEVLRVWKNVLKEKEKRHAKISGFKEGKLFVNVDSSAWLYQFNLKKLSATYHSGYYKYI